MGKLTKKKRFVPIFSRGYQPAKGMSLLTNRYPDLLVQASGGVSGLNDLKKLKETGVDSAITGKALLEGCFTVSEAIKAAR